MPNIKYLLYIISVLVFLLLYVWQNVEIMKIKIDYRKTLEDERLLVKKNDRLRYEIAGLRRMEIVERKAVELGMRELTVNDFVAIDVSK
jgi:hypothetical protein